jgi:DNA-binding response OmpR family regulator
MELGRSQWIRFGTFEAEPATGQLRKAGRSVRIQDLPFRLLLLLLQCPGEIVTCDRIREDAHDMRSGACPHVKEGTSK